MSLIYKVKKSGIQQENMLNLPLSTNIEKMRNEIKSLINKNQNKALYSNPIRFIIDKDDEQKSENEIKIESSKSLSERIDAEIIKLMKKELKQFKFINNVEIVDEQQINESDYGFNIETMKDKHAYILSSVNMNTRQFVSFLDMLSNLFSPVYVMKSIIDDSYTERIVVIVGEHLANNTVSSQVSNNQSSFIDYLYTVYSRALFVLKSSEEEYKQFTKTCIDSFRKVEMI